MTPTLTGRSTVLILLFASLLPGTKARSGMNAPYGTPMNRLLSTSQTEQFCAYADTAPSAPMPASSNVAMLPTSLLISLPPSDLDEYTFCLPPPGYARGLHDRLICCRVARRWSGARRVVLRSARTTASQTSMLYAHCIR